MNLEKRMQNCYTIVLVVYRQMMINMFYLAKLNSHI